MTLEDWARRVDDVLATREPLLRQHVAADSRAVEALRSCGVTKFTPGDPLWTANAGSVGARVAEDDATLRVVFIPGAQGAIHERTFVRSDAGAVDAGAEIAAFLSAR